jgi:hypothetical protein
MEEVNKSPNRLWRESGTTLTFAEWIQREKDKNNFLVNKKFENFNNIQGVQDIQSVQGFKDENETWLEDIKNQSKDFFGINKPANKKNDNTFFGLSKPVLVISALIIIGAIGYKIYQKRK